MHNVMIFALKQESIELK